MVAKRLSVLTLTVLVPLLLFSTWFLAMKEVAGSPLATYNPDPNSNASRYHRNGYVDACTGCFSNCYACANSLSDTR